jgi:hypothetical protein
MQPHRTPYPKSKFLAVAVVQEYLPLFFLSAWPSKSWSLRNRAVIVQWGLCAGLCILPACQKKITPSETTHSKPLTEVNNHVDLVSYNTHIRPILSDKCFYCHGPDEKNNKAGLRLDTPETAFAALKESEGYAITPGNPEQSAVWHRITSNDPDEIMPPPESKLVLTQEEKKRIHQWITHGAAYQEHWAFANLPATVPVPRVSDPAFPSWQKHPIDQFVLARLQHENLLPSPESSPLRWLRRVTLDLTGLPPSPKATSTFLADTQKLGEKAYEKTVDALLASQEFGEHQAVSWLDAARYADSYGFQSDQLNGQWPYRDWVIKAFNDNLPYNEFLTWNLAGDLMPDATREQFLATSFNRLHRLTNEGGSVRDEFLVENAADRVNTFGTAMLGLTLECARCHDHKYDPISARDYFSLTSFFNSIPENGLYDHPAKIPSPSLLLPTPEQQQKITQTADTAKQQALDYQQFLLTREAAFQQWLSSQKALEPPIADLHSHYAFDDSPASIPNLAGSPKDIGNAPKLIKVDGVHGSALRFDGDNGAVFPHAPLLDRHTPFTLSLWLKDPTRSAEPVVILQRTHGTDVGYNGIDIMLENGIVEARIYRVWPGNGIGVRSLTPIAQNQWSQLTWSYDGSSQTAGLRLYLNGQELQTQSIGTKLVKNTSINTYGSGHLTLGQRFRDRGFKAGEIDDFFIYQRALTPIEVKHLHDGESLSQALKAPQANAEVLRPYYLSSMDSQSRNSLSELTQSRLAAVKAEDVSQEIPIMRELASPRPTYILERGEYDSPRHEKNRVQRDTFESILPPFPAQAPRNRLGLAQWLTHPDHPLTSRVIVNRIWQNFFGQGIITTPENFGLQGAIPSHPALLDWLSRDFVNHGWDIKRLCKMMVLSSVYRQKSTYRADLQSRDPENVLLARGPSYRLSAEQIRDLALASSGLLDAQRGGPPVSPYQPGKDLWRESNSMSPAYRQSTGKALHRRSVYSVWKRTAPLPNMSLFDAPSREVCNVARSRTNTPLQALVLLNDVQFVEAARSLASLILQIPESDEIQKMNAAFLRTTGRPPTSKELVLLIELLHQQREHYTAHPDDALKLISLGESKLQPSDVSPAEHAAFTIVCQAIYNLDATIWKR